MNRIATMAVAGLLLIAVGSPARAQVKGGRLVRIPDSAVVQLVKLRDGSNLVGRFVDVSGDPLRFETSGGTVSIRRADLREVREVSRATVRDGEAWPEDPNPTRLFVGPTARVLPAGDSDFSSTYVFFLGGTVGVGGNAQLGGGFSVFPLEDFTDNLFYATAKVSFSVSSKAQLAVGGLAGWAGGFDDDLGGAGLGAVYGVGTFGSRDHAITTGIAVPFGEVETIPVFLFGGETRIGKRVKLMAESYWVFDRDPCCFDVSEGVAYGRRTDVVGVFGYGLRIFGDRIAVDLGFGNSTEASIFPGLPYVGFAVRF